MKRNTGKYKEVKVLPKGAMTVKEYATSNDISQSLVYKRIERNKANFQIVIFQSINFIVPLTNN